MKIRLTKHGFETLTYVSLAIATVVIILALVACRTQRTLDDGTVVTEPGFVDVFLPEVADKAPANPADWVGWLVAGGAAAAVAGGEVLRRRLKRKKG